MKKIFIMLIMSLLISCSIWNNKNVDHWEEEKKIINEDSGNGLPIDNGPDV